MVLVDRHYISDAKKGYKYVLTFPKISLWNLYEKRVSGYNHASIMLSVRQVYGGVTTDYTLAYSVTGGTSPTNATVSIRLFMHNGTFTDLVFVAGLSKYYVELPQVITVELYVYEDKVVFSTHFNFERTISTFIASKVYVSTSLVSNVYSSSWDLLPTSVEYVELNEYEITVTPEEITEYMNVLAELIPQIMPLFTVMMMFNMLTSMVSMLRNIYKPPKRE